jgi:hypothetical protein
MERIPLLLLFGRPLGATPHVHIAKDGREAKIWLHDLTVAVNMGFASHELGEIVRKAREERLAFLEKWNDHFGA